jgi:hypothetical protein
MIELTPIKGSILKSRINTFVAFAFVGTCALWAALVVVEAAFGVNPIEQAFAQMIYSETIEMN